MVKATELLLISYVSAYLFFTYLKHMHNDALVLYYDQVLFFLLILCNSYHVVIANLTHVFYIIPV